MSQIAREAIRDVKKKYPGRMPPDPLACSHANVCAVCSCITLQQWPTNFSPPPPPRIVYETLITTTWYERNRTVQYCFVDHAACTSLLNRSHPFAKLSMGTCDSIDLDIWYQFGWANADALSRNPVEATVAQVQSSLDSVSKDKDLVKQSQIPSCCPR